MEREGSARRWEAACWRGVAQLIVHIATGAVDDGDAEQAMIRGSAAA